MAGARAEMDRIEEANQTVAVRLMAASRRDRASLIVISLITRVKNSLVVVRETTVRDRAAVGGKVIMERVRVERVRVERVSVKRVRMERVRMERVIRVLAPGATQRSGLRSKRRALMRLTQARESCSKPSSTDG